MNLIPSSLKIYHLPGINLSLPALPQSNLSKIRRAIVLFIVAFFCAPPAIFAYQYPDQGTQWTVSGSQATKSTPSGLKMRVTISGAVNVFGLINDTTLQMQNNTTVPQLPAAANGLQILTTLNTCQTSFSASLTCSGLGTATIDFLDASNNPVKVVNPRLHISRVGGNVTGTSNVYFGITLSLTTAGVTMGTPATGSNNLTVASNTLRQTTTSSAITGVCSTTGAATAGCGTVPFTGTTSQLAFNIGAIRDTTATAWNFGAAEGVNSQDGWFITVSFDEDFSDAPSAFNSTQAPSHIASDLMLGSSVDVENTTTLNSTSSPSAVSTGADNNGTNGDGADEDAISSFPTLLTTAASYSLTVPISGTSRQGEVCGWIDFNNSNAFDSGEKRCSGFNAGATSVTLNWSGLSSLAAGNLYVRLRASFNSSQIQNPTGLADSGETEDYRLTIVAPPSVSLVKSCTSPANCTATAQLPNTDLTFSISFTNSGGMSASGLIIVDKVPDNTDFKIGSSSVNAGSTGLTIVTEYSSDYSSSNPAAATWTYSPLSGAGGAAAGYDRNVKAVRWRVTSGSLSQASPNNNGSVGFISRIR